MSGCLRDSAEHTPVGGLLPCVSVTVRPHLPWQRVRPFTVGAVVVATLVTVPPGVVSLDCDLGFGTFLSSSASPLPLPPASFRGLLVGLGFGLGAGGFWSSSPPLQHSGR